MIESREQRKRSSRLRRSKIIIIISVVLVAISAIALYFVYDYVNNVIPYVDEADGTTYYIKPVNGVWVMYDADGKLLEKDIQSKASVLVPIRAIPAFPIDFVSLFYGASGCKYLKYAVLSVAGIASWVIIER